MHSDFWADMICGATKFSNNFEFDFSEKTETKRAYPKKVIKYFLDSLHLQVRSTQKSNVSIIASRKLKSSTSLSCYL